MSTKQIERLKKKFYDKFYQPRGIEGFHIDGNIFDIWSWILENFIPIKKNQGGE